MTALIVLLSVLVVQDPGSQLQQKVADLVKKLGAEDLETRDAAERSLVELGEAALPWIEKVRRHDDPEIASRLEGAWRVLDRKRRAGRLTDDPALKAGIERWMKTHPDQRIIVKRFVEYRAGRFAPVEGLSMSFNVHFPDDVERNRQPNPVAAAPTDANGWMFLENPPKGRLKFSSYGSPVNRPLQDPACFLRFPLGEIIEDQPFVRLPDGEFVPPMKWTAPAPDAVIHLSDNASVSWEPYPEVRSVQIMVIGRSADKTPTGCGPVKPAAGSTKIALAEVLKNCPQIQAVGPLQLSLTGYDAAGNAVTGSAKSLVINLTP